MMEWCNGYAVGWQMTADFLHYNIPTLQHSIILEGVAYAEVEAEGVEDGGDVVIGVDRLSQVRIALFVVAVSLIRRMYAHAEVKPDNKPVDIQS